eukprot:TRINITY_DN1723_c0_g5_i1.p1 TRINITY_DN1723_c0_g5~~TRINITY_DN1723_c0_g5_i1.p1  ORF type:complete len:652 (-),score=72.94 TRINITY_DN1723_c0_g5_i1:304-2259(-)
MSSSDSVHSQKMDSRFSTPAPELDDHRPTRVAVPNNMLVPSVEVHQATPAPSGIDEKDLEHIDASLLHNLERSPIARDFEHAILDDDEKSDGEPGSARRIPHRRPTNRDGRPRVQRQERQDRSRDTSSSRSTSPANSVEAFAEPRRRQRANTAESHSSSIIENLLRRTQSGGTTQRRPTFSNVSIPGPPTHRTDRAYDDDVPFDADEEPGKTYKIDYEELEEYVALVAQGKIIDDAPPVAAGNGRVFDDLRRKDNNKSKESLPNVALNGDNFYENPLTAYETATTETSSDEKFCNNKTSAYGPAERFYLFSSELPHGQRATKLGDFVADGTTFRDLFDIGLDGGVWWLDVLNPTPSELSVLAKAFKIHRLTAEDIQTQEAREKVELFPQYYFVCFRTFNPDHSSEDFLEPIHVYIVVTSDGVLSFSYTPNPHARNVRKRIAKLPDFESLGPDYICYAMIDDIVDCFAPPIRAAEQESEAIEDQVFVAREDNLVSLLKQIGECRKRVLNMMRLLGGKADVIKGFAKRCNDQYQMTPRGDIGLYLGDIQDHVVTMMSNLGHVEKMLSRSHGNYLAQLNVDSIMKGNNTNKALTKITVVATILVPLNLITGLFGMNVTVPGEATGELYWFFGIIGGIFLFVCCCLLIVRRLKVI